MVRSFTKEPTAQCVREGKKGAAQKEKKEGEFCSYLYMDY